MKRYIALFSLLFVFVSLLVGCDSIKRMGKDQYYVQITTDGIEKTEKDSENNTFKYYEYKLPGFDKEGKEKQLEFTADKNLRKKAFLRVHHSNKKGVVAWEEVKNEELPAKVKEKLGVK
ncbi:YxeA family protein [Bacillus thuringiensis]|uniref:Uncharacterized protein n=1 Tax=Bacillus thuringiensis TaxID=1428 RepID=A0A9W3XJ01_BACTU|nr:YxeA family protein [Bacillus thuringiensis]AQY39117.1 hypothetical protein B4918_14575 [Bacillus thuringiensis]MDR4150836.1 YxeA family protein [Bacillus thuringiensis]MEC3573787.1 YxeA family protein [Bacillus thuringiensis]MED2022042.1 YxeA family protein [Bacillus thuringiensis]MED2143663.1 YxeA family protein [Bacillus thuringiensis]